jgi:signal transduction histidine kinase
VVVFDTEGRAVAANPAISELLDCPPDQIAGCGIDSLLGDSVDEEGRELVLSLLRGGRTRYPSARFRWGEKTLSASVAPVRLDSGEHIGTVAVFRDFTREAEIDRLKSAFVSSASHELRTPVNAVLGYAEMLQEGVYGHLSDAQRHATDRIVSNAGHLLSLANNLLDQAQIEAGRLTLHETSFAPADLVRSVQAMMGVLADAKGLKLSSDIAEDVPNILCGDRQRVYQILVNLVDNAIKFTEDGTVRVYVYKPDADHWAFEVSDPGCGIPEDFRVGIFEPFRQAQSSVVEEHAGAGLGLSIVKQLVGLMGGRITLDTEVGRGSTFIVTLPLSLP